MKRILKFIVATLCLTPVFMDSNAQQIRLRQNFDDNWLFAKGDFENVYKINFDDKKWTHINLPHDFRISENVDSESISGPQQGYFPGAVVWYRKKFTISPSEKNKQVIIQFDGVHMNSDYWVNGKHIGSRASGFISFWFDITPYLYFDRPNIISVRVDDYHQPFNRWYSGGGIYRHVWINYLDDIHIPVWGTYIAFQQVDNKKANGKIEISVSNSSDKQKVVNVTTEIYNPEGKLVNSQKSEITIESKGNNKLVQSIEIEKPNLWSLETPKMYKAISKLSENDIIIDEYQTPFGIRSIEFTSRQGFLLNGKKVILKGVNLHQDAGCMGTAVPEKVFESRLKTLKEIGCNAIRMSHYPHSPELLDMCDKMGFLVFDEFIDKWSLQYPGYNGATAPFFESWKDDLKLFIDRDRNHPSVFIWSMGNEVKEQFENPTLAKEIYDMMQNFTHNYEPTRKVTAALERSDQPSSMISNMDVVSYNYSTHLFAEWAAHDTSLIFISTETVPYSILLNKFARTDTVDFSKNSWFYEKENYAGQFIWAGFDYLGESKGWPDRGCPVGLVTTSGTRKPYSYFTESIYSEKPMVHLAVYDSVEAARLEAITHGHRYWYGPPIASHWNFNSGDAKPIPVYAFSNTDSVKLFLNNNYIGTSIPSAYSDKVARFDVKYVPGIIKAVGYINGKAVAEHQLKTAENPQKITILSDASIIKPDGKDVALLRVYVTDKSGTICPFAKNEIQFRVSGAGEIAGIDNGDVSQHFNFKNNALPTVNGQCMAVVRSNGKAGKIIIEARTIGLEPARITLYAK